MIGINYYASIGAGQGYSGSAEQYCIYLDKRPDVDVINIAFNKVPLKNISKAGKKLKSKPYQHHPIGLVHGFPATFDSALGHEFKIGFTMFETTKLPVDNSPWSGLGRAVDNINQMDLLFVPASFNIEIFRNHGVTIPIEVIPNGINRQHFPYIDRKHDGKPFTFLQMATLTQRKNPGDVISAFVSLFGGRDDVKLVLKTQSGTLGHLDLSRLGNIEVIDEVYNMQQMRQLMADADCFVFPSRGEGFGMPPVEAMATGLPTIVSDNSGMSDYADPSYCYPIRTAHESPAFKYPKPWGDVGNWWQPDYEHLKEQMLYVFEHQEEAREKGKLASKAMHENYNYDVIAQKMVDAIHKHSGGKYQ